MPEDEGRAAGGSRGPLHGTQTVWKARKMGYRKTKKKGKVTEGKRGKGGRGREEKKEEEREDTWS